MKPTNEDADETITESQKMYYQLLLNEHNQCFQAYRDTKVEALKVVTVSIVLGGISISLLSFDNQYKALLLLYGSAYLLCGALAFFTFLGYTSYEPKEINILEPEAEYQDIIHFVKENIQALNASNKSRSKHIRRIGITMYVITLTLLPVYYLQ